MWLSEIANTAVIPIDPLCKMTEAKSIIEEPMERDGGGEFLTRRAHSASGVLDDTLTVAFEGLSLTLLKLLQTYLYVAHVRSHSDTSIEVRLLVCVPREGN